MYREVDISETRQGMILRELAQLGLSLARDLHAEAMEAKDSDAAVKLANAFHKISRGVRQTLALESQMSRAWQKHGLELAPLREKERLAQVSRRHTQVFRAIERIAWAEAETPEQAQSITEDLREELDFACLDDSFLAEPLSAQIDRIRAMFDLVGPAAAEDDPANPAEVPDEDVDNYESSNQSWGARIGRPAADGTLFDPPAPDQPNSS